MNDFVALYDESIKTMKSSQYDESNVEKCKKFKTMISPYLDLMEKWSQETVSPNSFSIHKEWGLDGYLKTIRSIFNGINERKTSNLQPSRDFSVSAAALGSNANFERHLPETLEDVFTLSHQNLNATVALLCNQLFTIDDIKESVFPAKLKLAMEMVQLIRGESVCEPQRTGITVKDNRILVTYNVPLNNHSGTFTFEYVDGKRESVTMHAKFLGHDRWSWTTSKKALNLLNQFPHILFKAVKINSQEFSYSIDLGKDEEIKHAIELYRLIAEKSLSSKVNPVYIYNLYLEHGLIDERNLTEIYKNAQQSNQEDLKRYALELYLTFIGYNNLEFTEKKIGKMLKELDQYDWESILHICKKHLKEGRGYDLVEKVVAEAINVRFNIVRSKALQLILKLFEKERGYEVAEKVVAKGLKDSYRNNRYWAFDLLEKLVEKERGYELAEKEAAEGIKDSDANVRCWAFGLFCTLVEKEYGYELAEKAAVEGLNDSDLQVRFVALFVFKELVNKGHGYELAEKAATEMVKESDLNLRYQALFVLEELVNKGRGYELAEKSATDLEKDPDERVRKKAKELLKRVGEMRKSVDMT
ncbi:MAG: hypothetical protein AAGG81_06560, partial [Chlamydiota bacterium]